MAVNEATKFSPKVDERFKQASFIRQVTNQDYDWTGVKTVSVYSVDTADMNDYQRSGTNRYGTPEELGTDIQELPVEQDRSFAYTIDKGNHNEQMMVTRAGRSLRRQIDEKVIPEYDKYVLEVMVDNAGNATTEAAIDKDNAYQKFLEANELMHDDLVPSTGRIALLTYQYYNFLKQGNFVLDTPKGQDFLVTGAIGQTDGVKLVPVPRTYFPANTELVIAHPSATVAPTKLNEYKTHDNPPGVNGWWIEGRQLYDAFVLNNKANAIAVHKTPA